jgi:hypothetical protein
VKEPSSLVQLATSQKSSCCVVPFHRREEEIIIIINRKGEKKEIHSLSNTGKVDILLYFLEHMGLFHVGKISPFKIPF